MLYFLGAVIVVYIVLMFFYPEWVGITGKKALKNIRSHKAETPETKKEDLPHHDEF